MPSTVDADDNETVWYCLPCCCWVADGTALFVAAVDEHPHEPLPHADIDLICDNINKDDDETLDVLIDVVQAANIVMYMDYIIIYSNIDIYLYKYQQ